MVFANTGKQYALIGCDKLQFNKVTKDTSEEYTVDGKVQMIGLGSYSFNPNTSTVTMYGDDMPYDSAVGNGELQVSVGIPQLFPELEAYLFGHEYDADTGELLKGDPSPKSLCIRLRLKKNNGAFRYVAILSAKASEGAVEVTGKQGSVAFQTSVIDFLAASILKNGKHMRVIDSDDINNKLTVEALETIFFGPDPLAPFESGGQG